MERMSRLLVLKFGGHALANPARVRVAARRIAAWRKRGVRVVAVVSAPAGFTDRLLGAAARSATTASHRELDRLLCTGEDRSAALLALALTTLGVPARSLRGAEAGLIATGDHGAGHVTDVDIWYAARARPGDRADRRRVQAGRPDGEHVTLGRGGSDLTAVVLATALGASACHLIKDVNGVHTRDPRHAADAKPIASLSHEQLLLLARSGARVVHAGAAAHARSSALELRVYSYRAPQAGGTRIGAAA
jgi:aspartate kinase